MNKFTHNVVGRCRFNGVSPAVVRRLPLPEKIKFECVDKNYYKSDRHHAPYEMVEARTRNQAKYKYLKLHSECKYIDILCRKSIGTPQW